MCVVGEPLAQHLQQAGLAHAGIAGNERDLSSTVFDVLPQVEQQADLLLPPYERGQRAGIGEVQTTSHAAGAYRAEELHGLGHALQLVASQIFEDEDPGH